MAVGFFWAVKHLYNSKLDIGHLLSCCFPRLVGALNTTAAVTPNLKGCVSSTGVRLDCFFFHEPSPKLSGCPILSVCRLICQFGLIESFQQKMPGLNGARKNRTKSKAVCAVRGGSVSEVHRNSIIPQLSE